MLRIRKKIQSENLSWLRLNYQRRNFFFWDTDNNYGWQCYTVGHLRTVMEEQTDN